MEKNYKNIINKNEISKNNIIKTTNDKKNLINKKKNVINVVSSSIIQSKIPQENPVQLLNNLIYSNLKNLQNDNNNNKKDLNNKKNKEVINLSDFIDDVIDVNENENYVDDNFNFNREYDDSLNDINNYNFNDEENNNNDYNDNYIDNLLLTPINNKNITKLIPTSNNENKTNNKFKWNLTKSTSPIKSTKFERYHQKKKENEQPIDKEFLRHRERLSVKYYQHYNKIIWENKLPINLPILWDLNSIRCAGLTTCIKKGKELSVTKIELSHQYNKTDVEMRRTLVHEMCHVAAWLIDGYSGHSKPWIKWTKICEKKCPEIAPIGRYVFDEWEYPYYCSNKDCRKEFVFFLLFYFIYLFYFILFRHLFINYFCFVYYFNMLILFDKSKNN